MYKVSDNPTREEALKFISKSASFGNLGLFIGAGFSKAVMNSKHNTIALSWGELLSKCTENLGIDFNAICKEGISYPEIATTICEKHSLDNKTSYEDSLQILKKEICSLTSWYPDKEKREEYSSHLISLEAAWIITTNYDLIIESLLTGKSITLSPKDQLITPTNITPVYHLHGVRIDQESIIISQEDYVALFRPSEYRQIKLALTIKESTVLILGYGLGDVNVLTALDWSKNVFKEEQSNYPHDVIQVIKKDKPKTDPYRSKNGVLIVETSELDHFFSEFSGIRTEEKKLEKEETDSLNKLVKELNDPKKSMIEKFIDDNKYRKKALNVLSNFQIHIISGFVTFLNKCLDEAWERSSPSGAFEGYSQYLNIILDILINISYDAMPPALFETVAYGLERVGYYIDKTGVHSSGNSFSATDKWHYKKKDLPDRMVEELRNYSEQHGCAQLSKLIETIKK
jgi:SIR2-like domain